jgi:NADPH:quinone reductase-like Zn-dependent oxidoreductase
VGSSVTSLEVGDSVYSRVPNQYRGSAGEYVLSVESAVASMPSELSFTQAASIPLAALTALQCMEKADSMLEGGLKGKAVFVPAGLGGTGSFAIQLAKNVFGAGRVVTTLSTKKINTAMELFGTDSIQYVDYTENDVVTAVGKGTIDYMFDTMAGTMKYLPVMKKDGVILSISTICSGSQMKNRFPETPALVKYALNLVDWFFRYWTGRSGARYSYVFMTPDSKGLEKLANYVKEGKIAPVVGRTAKLSDINEVRTGCQEILDGKGGVGKFVIEVV